jgi:alpha-tubulin suppressor-like RCC1 family protein
MTTRMLALATVLTVASLWGCEEGEPDRNATDSAIDTRTDAGRDAATEGGDTGQAMSNDAGDTRTDAGRDAATEGGDSGQAMSNDAGDSSPGVAGSSHVVQASAGDSHTCAVMDDGTVRCWGQRLTASSHGLTGIVTGLANVAEVAAGLMHTCARLQDGTVRCWGVGVAVSSVGGSSDPAFAVPGLDNVIRIAAGGRHTCALLEGGTVRCWGSDSFGQVSAERPAACEAAPGNECEADVTAVPGVQDAVDIAAGGEHSCAVLRDGSVLCWGDDFYGQATDRKATLCPTGFEPSCFEASPVTPVATITNATQVSAGRRNTCVRREDESVRCWGASDGGDASPGDSAINIGEFQGAASVATGSLNTCVVKSDKSVVCSGAIESNLEELGQNPEDHRQALASLSDVSQLTAGAQHVCAVSEDGTLRCWGLDGAGQIDDQVPDGCDGLEGPCYLPATVVQFN